MTAKPATMSFVSESPFTIASDPHDWGKLYWEAFASEAFPSYEDFWLAHVVPLPNRATDRLGSDVRIRFRTDAELAADNRGHEDVATRRSPSDGRILSSRAQNRPRTGQSPFLAPATRKPPICGGFLGGRYWARTSDPQLVELVLSQLS
jgi:hypothetical protein